MLRIVRLLRLAAAHMPAFGARAQIECRPTFFAAQRARLGDTSRRMSTFGPVARKELHTTIVLRFIEYRIIEAGKL